MSPAMREIVADLEHDGACQCQTCRSERHYGIAADERPEPASVECYDDYYFDDEDDR